MQNNKNLIIAINFCFYFTKCFRDLEPGWKEWTYCKGMILANESTWNEVFKQELYDELLEFLACSEKNDIIIRYIDLFVSGYFNYTELRVIVFHSIIARHAKNNLVLDYILANFARILSR